MNLLVVYDLDAGRLLRMEEYAEPREALEARVAAEETAVGRYEIVVLSGELVDMRRTHGKYFA